MGSKYAYLLDDVPSAPGQLEGAGTFLWLGELPLVSVIQVAVYDRLLYAYHVHPSPLSGQVKSGRGRAGDMGYRYQEAQGKA